ncbi:conserved protein of unknown function [Methylocella tundrae]|uniref:Uncharacterized protein n=1 Tax=Methylocella tundrae TaxID=227605 RepID=A0A4U8Z548_METTU|nr:conserved protein of unknown function [Methylocella tundrae]
MALSLIRLAQKVKALVLPRLRAASALAGLVALLRLVDDVNTALAAHELVVAMTPAQRFQ